MVSNTSVPYEYNYGCPIGGMTCLPFTSTCIHLFSFCALFLFVCLRVVSCVLNVVHSWLPIWFSVFCFYFVCLHVVSCILNAANVSGCPFMIVADLVFCVLFLIFLSPCCVLYTQCCPFMIVADLVFCLLFLFCLSPSCVLCTHCCQCLWLSIHGCCRLSFP
jgi:hypothetical protein